MGARGPGARPKPKQQPAAVALAPDPKQWQHKRTRAARLVAWIEANLKITTGPDAGKPFKLRPWQREWIEEIYRTGKNGRRLVRTAVLSVARKNGKSTLVSAVSLAHLLGTEREPRGQIYIGATDRDQANVIFAEVEAMLEASPWLRDQVNVQRSAKRVESYIDGSELVALSSDARKAHGLNPTLVILDELAQWGSGIGIRLYNALMTAGGARAEPLKLIISTQAEDDTSKMSELIDYGEQVNAGVIENPTFWGRTYTVPEELDPFDETGWPLANPALGDFRTLADMRELAERAKRMPTERAAFENLYLNRRVAADERWIDKPTWLACQGEIDPEALVGQDCFGGLDLASVSDLTSLALFFPKSGAVLLWNWLPADRVAERSERDRVPYDVWAEQGLIELTPGKATSKKVVARRLDEISRRYQPRAIGFDRHGMKEIDQILEEEGIELPLVEHGQGFVSMSPSMKATEAKVLNRELVHDNAVLTWAVSNVRLVRDDADNHKPSKGRSREKIDPAVALIMAIGVAVQHQDEPDDRAFRQDDVLRALRPVAPLEGNAA